MTTLSKRKKIVFVSGTRADFSKMKSLMKKVEDSKDFEAIIFATGMHLSKNFGLTVREIEKSGFQNIYRFINHDKYYQMDLALSSTIDGFSKFINEYEPDLIVVHGDRIEPLAAAIVGALNNILVAHIEGGEVSGTIDDSLRHSISKLAHIHLVNDSNAQKRLLQLGENKDSIFIIGSPDLDILAHNDISLDAAKKYYDIDFSDYAIAIFHPVTTELDSLESQINEFVTALIESKQNYIVIYPNNDLGFNIILNAYKRLENNAHFKLFPSLRFEYFITLLKHCKFIIGNSSCILKEAVFFGVHGINVGTRQNNRAGINNKNITNVGAKSKEILNAIKNIESIESKHTDSAHNTQNTERSDTRFYNLLEQGNIFNISKQKTFRDIF
ncbi:UDP-N-acetylglucosamine 2-epimerase (hydrolyzing) [Helicobacter saguini]|uniref:UDP-N-acetylglucosamine 2-epimerase (Hydrolyzing) n=1 Tax=Helicobacter saguini TaxID=1548018 RepID=A0A347W4S0_9HELI|nr:UDP-N-acetylglucosamine 2-epimerase [Helicobacter saguini]MWV61736.1 UDP-N-acetylglucosamine 2-epimerase (hydrolyzing) [Helicobacter saguini]MWV67591.1 UDP-N-acetylglucosamine 2-epimerase (hydrolyzing) [Helicobacter saguini]MWV69942.1 UDP-N-acetylglucosamine 2-epimerase (hydrolyzing) [Helicobacter saguini]MWV72843.1 UDP-N-acetylglucosamine 2-epimerase (hydrolyzing) [Helicobacter saguini]TLD92383.1 UDP-N-acetylglucosamine 2-epimerase (hydrolyzing) [Helicobacter saguini]